MLLSVVAENRNGVQTNQHKVKMAKNPVHLTLKCCWSVGQTKAQYPDSKKPCGVLNAVSKTKCNRAQSQIANIGLMLCGNTKPRWLRELSGDNTCYPWSRKLYHGRNPKAGLSN